MQVEGQAPELVQNHHLTRANGTLLHYVMAGKGDPVVILHGFAQTSYQWRRHIIPALAQRYFVIAPDLRGAGESEKPEDGYDKRMMAEDIYQLVQHLGLDSIYLVGHDFGAAVAYAAAHRDAVRRLAILEMWMAGFGYEEGLTYPFRKDGLGRDVWHLVFHEAPFEVVETLISSNVRMYFRWFYTSMSYDPHAIPEADLDEYERHYASPGGFNALKYYRTHETDAEHNRESAKTPLEMPVLAVGGEAFMGTIPQESMEALASDVRGAIIPRCGHWMTEECPDAVVDLLLNFFGEEKPTTVPDHSAPADLARSEA